MFSLFVVSIVLYTIQQFQCFDNRDLSTPVIKIDEGQPVGSFVTNIREMLPDIARAQSYSFIDDEVSEYFYLSNVTFNLYIKQILDHRKLCVIEKMCECQHCILYLSLAMSLEAKIDFEVFQFLIVDIDNHHPFFPDSSVTIIVDENQEPNKFSLPFAKDNDFLDSENLTYYLNFTDFYPSALFSLHQNDQELFLEINEPLDREEQSEYQLWLTAKGRKLSTTIEILIVVNDQNDNYPSCDYNAFTISTTYYGNLGQLRAVDHDAINTPNSKLIFNKIDSKFSHFVDIQTNGNIRLNKQLVDHSVHIPFSVHDNGYPKLSAECFTTITIVKSPVLSMRSVTDDVIFIDSYGNLSLMYISNVLEKNQPLLNIDMSPPYTADGNNTSKFTVDCSLDAFQIHQLSSNRFTLNLKLNLSGLSDQIFKMSCFDEQNSKVRNDYDIKLFIIPQYLYSIQFPENNSRIEIKSVDNITVGPLTSLDMVLFKHESNEVEKVYYTLIYNSGDILMHIDNGRDIYIDHVWKAGQFTLQINLVGNISGYVYQKIIVYIQIPEDVYQLFAHTHKKQPFAKAYKPELSKHKQVSIMFSSNLALELLIVTIMVIVVVTIGLLCIKFDSVLNKCKKLQKAKSNPSSKYDNLCVTNRDSHDVMAAKDYDNKAKRINSNLINMSHVVFNKSPNECTVSLDKIKSVNSSPLQLMKSVTTFNPFELQCTETHNGTNIASANYRSPSLMYSTLNDNNFIYNQSSFV